MSDERPADRAFVVWNGRVLVESLDAPTPIAVGASAFAPEAPVIPVFSDGGTNVATYLLDVADEDAANAAVDSGARGGVFADIMSELGRSDARERAAVMRAIAVERWSNRYRFCPACAYPLIWTTDAIAKICTNPTRVHRHFPRLDPAIIVLVSDGDRVLLGRAARWPAGFYSALAGFVEPGETLEQTIRREVFEEAGIVVGATRYFGSESWPFPRSLMLGFFADARSNTIALNDAELEDARWFTSDEAGELQRRMKIARPFFDTIARRMIDRWIADRIAR